MKRYGDFGCLNMYGAIQWKKTQEEYKRDNGLLDDAGVSGILEARMSDLQKW